MPGGGSAISVLTDSPLVGCEGRDGDESSNALMAFGLGDHRSPIGMADEDRRPVLKVEHVSGRLDVA